MVQWRPLDRVRNAFGDELHDIRLRRVRVHRTSPCWSRFGPRLAYDSPGTSQWGGVPVRVVQQPRCHAIAPRCGPQRSGISNCRRERRRQAGVLDLFESCKRISSRFLLIITRTGNSIFFVLLTSFLDCYLTFKLMCYSMCCCRREPR